MDSGYPREWRCFFAAFLLDGTAALLIIAIKFIIIIMLKIPIILTQINNSLKQKIIIVLKIKFEQIPVGVVASLMSLPLLIDRFPFLQSKNNSVRQLLIDYVYSYETASDAGASPSRRFCWFLVELCRLLNLIFFFFRFHEINLIS